MLRVLHHPAIVVLLCCSLIGTPVTYRGGAPDPHPHTFLQFLIDARDGHFDHHHHGMGAEHGEPERMLHAPGHTALHALAMVEQDAVCAPGVESIDQFGPSFTAFVVGDVSQLALILPDDLLPSADRFDMAPGQAEALPAGITHAPMAPPPR